MNPETWQKAKSIFQQSLEQPDKERDVFVAQAGKGDKALCDVVMRMLQAHREADDFLERPDQDFGAVLCDVDFAEDEIVGRHFGPFLVNEIIGEGGMGIVYKATRDDAEFSQTVAIKVIKRGMDTKSLLQRFRRERQTLASLTHTNIARLLDGGQTDSGMPYFVMEYIEGRPIDEYCETHKLSIKERLVLFTKVCDAVNAAHQSLIIHRDLKPGNILISDSGEPKLLDFGIAKLLESDQEAITVDLTQAGAKLLTPEYASPEQILGKQMTTASDVYSLGVLLYVLLTGKRPYRFTGKTQQQLAAFISDVQPSKPSAFLLKSHDPSKPEIRQHTANLEKVSKTLRGDLDNIVLMAMHKEPARRYSSVAHLAEDLNRYLNDLPVAARTDTFSYRFTKFVQRHRMPVAFAILISLSLIGGIAATVWQARVAEQQSARAERRFNDVRKLANSVLFEFDKAISGIAGTTKARELVVMKALDYLDNLAQESGDDVSLQCELAVAYNKVSSIQWNRYRANLGDVDGAMQSIRKALKIREVLRAHTGLVPGFHANLAWDYIQLGDLTAAKHELTAALENYRRALKAVQSLPREKSAHKRVRQVLAVSYQRIGDTLGNPGFDNLGDTEGALANFRKMIAVHKDLAAADSARADDYLSVSIGYEKFGDVLDGKGDFSGSLDYFQQALVIRDSLHRAHPNNTHFMRDTGIANWKVAFAHEKLGNMAAAQNNCNRMLMIFRQMYEADQADAKALEDYTSALKFVGRFSLKLKDAEQAARCIGTALQIERVRADKADATANDLNNHAWSLLTAELQEFRAPAAALRYARRAAQITGEADANILDTLALAYFMSGDPRRAAQTEEKAIALLPEQSSLRQGFEVSLDKYKAKVNAAGN